LTAYTQYKRMSGGRGLRPDRIRQRSENASGFGKRERGIERRDSMKAISLLQPWASLVAVGAKRIETRSWPTRYRGPLAIHASKKWAPYQTTYLNIWEIQTGLAPLTGKPLDLSRLSWPGVEDKHLPLGVVLAVCNLVDCIPTENLTQGQIGTDRPFGDFSLGRYGWILDNVKPLSRPIPAKGNLGLWDWMPPGDTP
jgi:hypothetical protein